MKEDIKRKAPRKMGEMARKLATGAKNMENWRRNKTKDVLDKNR